ncbi:hypothetical protein BDV97DRAFT_231835 [Delphinella strobiligena]|nr:hypothetical protein BDV97DRAFT_231835 [Delphinella strobiligena]
MRFNIATAILISLASTSFAATVGVVSRCNRTTYVTFTNSAQVSTQYKIAPNGSYNQPLVGTGNAFGITVEANYFVPTTPKLVVGFSVGTTDHLTYWGVTFVDGNPFSGLNGFVVAPSDPSCTETTTSDGQVHVCTYTANLVIYLC